MATGRITKKVLDYIAHINKEAKQMNYVKELKKSVEHGKNGTQKYVIKKITDELSMNFSSKIKLNYKHDESLIGGLVVQVGSTMVDSSIKNKLQKIENRMVEEFI